MSNVWKVSSRFLYNSRSGGGGFNNKKFLPAVCRSFHSSSFTSARQGTAAAVAAAEEEGDDAAPPPTTTTTEPAVAATTTTDPSLMKAAFRDLLAKERAKALVGGGQSRIDKQHAKGSLTARERLELLFDNNGEGNGSSSSSSSFQELDQLKSHRCVDFGMNDPSKHFPGDGVVTGCV